MDIGNSALNFGFAAEHAARLAASIRGGEETVTAQLRQTTRENKLAVGTTITARYRYKVAEDGSFIPLQSQITTEAANEDVAIAGDGGRKQRRAFQRDNQERPGSFRDYTAPKPMLSPSDEASIFSALARGTLPNFALGTYTPRVQTVAIRGHAVAEVSDENGGAVEAEIIAPHTTAKPEAGSFSASFLRAQYAVANLYARTGDITSAPAARLQVAA